MLTLTCDASQFESIEDAYRRLSRAVNLLFKRLRRRFPRDNFAYALVWEVTRQGVPHLHILLRAPFIPQTLLSALWNQLAHSPIVDIRAIKNQRQAAVYVAKYLSKDPNVPKGMKRFRFSRFYSQTPQKLPISELFGIKQWAQVATDSPGIFELWTHHGLDLHTFATVVLVGNLPDAPPAELSRIEQLCSKQQLAG